METIIQLNQEDLKSALKDWLKDTVHELKTIPEKEPLPDQIDLKEVRRMTGKGNSWLYQRTMPKCKDPIPHKTFGRHLIFSRKEIQEYIDSHSKAIFSPNQIMTDRLQESAKKKV